MSVIFRVFRSTACWKVGNNFCPLKHWTEKSYSNFSMMPKLIPLYFIIYLYNLKAHTPICGLLHSHQHRYDCKIGNLELATINKIATTD
jgi:hypothetical protein